MAALATAQTANITLPDAIDPDDALIVQPLDDTDSPSLPVPADLPDGLHTLDVQGTGWRVFIYTAPPMDAVSSGRFVVSQQTETRDEVAWGSSLRTLLPMLLLAPILIAVVSEESRERLTSVQEGLGRMRRLVNQLLNLARLQGESQAADTAVDFQQVIGEF